MKNNDETHRVRNFVGLMVVGGHERNTCTMGREGLYIMCLLQVRSPTLGVVPPLAAVDYVVEIE